MALKKMREIAVKAKEKYPGVHKIAISHRLGEGMSMNAYSYNMEGIHMYI